LSQTNPGFFSFKSEPSLLEWGDKWKKDWWNDWKEFQALHSFEFLPHWRSRK